MTIALCIQVCQDVLQPYAGLQFGLVFLFIRELHLNSYYKINILTLKATNVTVEVATESMVKSIKVNVLYHVPEM
jgi:hypothetical protein